MAASDGQAAFEPFTTEQFLHAAAKEDTLKTLMEAKDAVPAALRTRKEDQERLLKHKNRTPPDGYHPLLGLACSLEQVAVNARSPEQVEAIERERLQYETSIPQDKALIEKLEREVEHEESKNGVESPPVASGDIGQKIQTSMSLPQPQQEEMAVLRDDEKQLSSRIKALESLGMRAWVRDSLNAAQEKVQDLVEGLPAPCKGLPGHRRQWSMYSLVGAYQHLWQSREHRDELLTAQRVTSEELRATWFGFLGLERAWKSRDGEPAREAALMSLLKTLVKLHQAAGKDTVPGTYQAYHLLCAQLYGPEKAAALLHDPLTEEEVLAMEGEDLSDAYVWRLAAGLGKEGTDETQAEAAWAGLEEARALHVRRLRGPWGRLYAKEFPQLCQALATLRESLPDPRAEKETLAQRLVEVRERLSSLEKELEHVLPTTLPAKSAPAMGMWTRLARWFSRLRGSLASKLRKFRDRVFSRGKSKTPSSQDDAPSAPSPLQKLQKKLKGAQLDLENVIAAEARCCTLIDYETRLQAALAEKGRLGEGFNQLALQAFDLQYEGQSLYHAGNSSADVQLGLALCRLCYIKEYDFSVALRLTDLEYCHSLVDKAYKRGFKLRRRGHTDRVRGERSLTAEELAQLEQLCAGMEGAKAYVHAWIDAIKGNDGERRPVGPARPTQGSSAAAVQLCI